MGYLGLIRFILAASVAGFHLWTPIFPDSGRHAVMGFFVISGFLITKIANETYADRPFAFLANRALRIYPTYWICLLIAFAAIAVFPETARLPWILLRFPSDTLSWLTNILIYECGSNMRTITQTWSLYIEVVIYLIIGLATFRSPALTLVGFAVSFASAIYGILHPTQYLFYFAPMGTAFVFFAGSLAYFVSKRRLIPPNAVIFALLIFAISAFALPHLVSVQDYSGPKPHAFLLISAASMFVAMSGIPRLPDPSRRLKSWFRLAGDCSYPVFLLHIATAVPVVAIFGDLRPVAFLGSLVLCTSISLLIVKSERKIDDLRTLIRGRGIEQAPLSAAPSA